MKQRFSSLDIKVIAQELSQTLTSLRVVNIYDLSSRIFLFKFAKPDHRESFIIDSGFRCHLTSFARTTATQPSPFVARLRKHLKTRRVTKVAQVGTDRILEFQFSEGVYRLFLEFYAGGNIVLTDRELNVLAVLRSVSDGAEHEHVKLGSVYNLSERQNVEGVPALTEERVKRGLQAYLDRMAGYADDQAVVAKKGKRSRAGEMLRKALASCINEFPPPLLEHGMRVAGVDAEARVQDVLERPEMLEQVMNALQEAAKVVEKVMASPVGHIMAKRKAQVQIEDVNSAPPKREDLLYEDYYPWRPKQLDEDKAMTVLDFETFNKAVDDFYSSIEGQKLESKLQEKEDAARKKLEHAKQDQERRIGSLQAVQETNVRKAQAIEANRERVEEAMVAINGLIAQGKGWEEIDRLIELEQKRHNPVAEMIKLPLKLNENTATLLLAEWDEEEEQENDGDITDEEAEDSDGEVNAQKQANNTTKKPEDKRLAIDVDLALSGYANAREYYEQRRTAASKQEKTVQASEKALKSAQYKIEADLKKALKQEKAVLRPMRQQLWFEKFIYFVSSDGYLVLGGRDAQTNDILYKKHFSKGDVFVRADLNGAAPFIIKNLPGMSDAPIPPSTLSQAGNLSVATSTAWESKAVMSAWWVMSEQISKLGPHGDYMQPGTFWIKGEKNFLPPAQLLLGFAVMFQISEESKARHVRHRVEGQSTMVAAEGDAAVGRVKNDEGVDAQAGLQGSGEAQSRQADGANDEEQRHSDDDEDIADETDSEVEDDESEDTKYVNPLGNGDSSIASQTEDKESVDGDAIASPPNHTDNTQQESNEAHSNHSAATASADEYADTDEEADTAESHTEAPSTSNPSTNGTSHPPPSKPTTTTTNTNPSIPIRGKRGKNNKISAKYADQTDEDRALALSLLGSHAGADKAAAEAAERATKQAEVEAAKQRRREQAEKAQKEGREREMKRLLDGEEKRLKKGGGRHEEDDEAEADADEDATVMQVDLATLVGTPLAGDEIVAAIPVCAPWSALGRYKYRAKLQPGSTKKGKAVREILGRWTADAANKRLVDESSQDIERVWPREVELLGGLKEREESCFGVVPVRGVRVMMGAPASGGGKGGGGGGQGKGKGGRGGRGSKKK